MSDVRAWIVEPTTRRGGLGYYHLTESSDMQTVCGAKARGFSIGQHIPNSAYDFHLLPERCAKCETWLDGVRQGDTL